MTILIVLLSILLLVLLITWARINSFLAFLVVSMLAALLLGVPAAKITNAIQKGIGDMLGGLVITICLGAMLGKLVAESGAAMKITNTLRKAFGEKNIQWALMVTGFIVGIPLFFDVSFVLLIPLVFSVVYQSKKSAIYLGLPMMAAISVTHGFLPPHPAPTGLVAQFNANMGLTLVYGIIVAIPAVLIGGPLFAQTVKNIKSTPLQTFLPKPIPEDKLPGAANSYFTSLLPVFLLVIFTLIPILGVKNETILSISAFLGSPAVVMTISLAVATYTLGLARGMKMTQIMNDYGDAVKDISMILLIIAGAGALKEVFIESGISKQIADGLQGLSVNPLILGWLIACIVRLAVGSATVAGLTAASIIAPVIATSHVNPNLMVLSVGAGSLMFSHVNDAGFWLIKEYFNITVKETILSWSLMEMVISLAGLGGVLLLNLIV